MTQLSHLMAPGRIGTMALRNRIFMSPMGSNTADPEGYCGERLLRYYEARAKGGAALLIMGSVSISWPVGSANYRQVAISDDRFIPGVNAVAEAVHAHGAKLAMQLQHAGLTAMNDIRDGRPMLTPSLPQEKHGDMDGTLFPEEVAAMSTPYSAAASKVEYRVATQEDIDWVIGEFAAAAERAQRAGVDGVELHAGHGYLIHSFLNPSVNKREDAYGGSIENRARLLVQVIEAIKVRCGSDYPVWCRLDGVEFLTEGGITNADAIRTAQLAEAAGADAIHVSAYADASKGASFTAAHTVHKPCGFVPYASAIKAAVSIPVIAPGRIEPEVGNRLIGEGKLDFITMARKLLADPELPNKIVENRLADVRPCIYCYTCISQIFVNKTVKCAVNARTGREHETLVSPAESPKKVLVIGAGPAGMEAARVADLRGHRVTLCDKSSRLGGTVFFSAVSYPPNAGLVNYLSRAIEQSSVEVQLNTEATPEWVRAQSPDVVVVATGARRGLPEIPGVHLPHVLSGDDIRGMITGESDGESKLPTLARGAMALGGMAGITGRPDWMRQLSRVWMPLGKRVVMIGGGLVAVELAEFLAERGRQVTVLEEGEVMGQGLMLVRRWRNLADCRDKGVEFLTRARVVAITDRTLTYCNANQQERTIDADQVIITSGAEGDLALADRLRGEALTVHSIGDCNGVSYIDGAIHAGFDLAQTL